MTEYTFEYTRQRDTYLLLLGSFSIIGIGSFLTAMFFSPNSRVLLIILFILIACSILFFQMNKTKVKRTGIARLSDTYMELQLDEFKSIQFRSLRYYYIYYGKNGPVFTLGFLDKSKLKIGANNNFCNDKLLMTFLNDFLLTIEEYKKAYGVNVIHLESIFARKNTVYVLVVLTVALILGFCFTTMPLMILPIGMSLPLLINWIQYFKLKGENKLTDI